jgi:hypothetical protein
MVLGPAPIPGPFPSCLEQSAYPFMPLCPYALPTADEDRGQVSRPLIQDILSQRPDLGGTWEQIKAHYHDAYQRSVTAQIPSVPCGPPTQDGFASVKAAVSASQSAVAPLASSNAPADNDKHPWEALRDLYDNGRQPAALTDFEELPKGSDQKCIEAFPQGMGGNDLAVTVSGTEQWAGSRPGVTHQATGVREIFKARRNGTFIVFSLQTFDFQDGRIDTEYGYCFKK